MGGKVTASRVLTGIATGGASEAARAALPGSERFVEAGFTGGLSETERAARGMSAGAPPAPNTPAPTGRGSETAAPDGAGEAAERARRQARARASSRGRTILTSPLGLSEPAPTAARMLLGR